MRGKFGLLGSNVREEIREIQKEAELRSFTVLALVSPASNG
jgi:hypothetical protein